MLLYTPSSSACRRTRGHEVAGIQRDGHGKCKKARDFLENQKCERIRTHFFLHMFAHVALVLSVFGLSLSWNPLDGRSFPACGSFVVPMMRRHMHSMTDNKHWKSNAERWVVTQFWPINRFKMVLNNISRYTHILHILVLGAKIPTRTHVYIPRVTYYLEILKFYKIASKIDAEQQWLAVS